MKLATVHSCALVGIDAPEVIVEVHISNGLPAMTIVGLPEAAVRESKDRVRAAIINSHFDFPARKITVNLAPADLPKAGGRYDLPIALGILAASDQIDASLLHEKVFIAELALSGMLRPVNGCLPTAMAIKHRQQTLVCAQQNADEAALVAGTHIITANDLLSICQQLAAPEYYKRTTPTNIAFSKHADLADVRGQYQARRALEVAAAGRHNLLMVGPPGTGKSMLASRLPGILPPMTEQQALESASVYSISHQGFSPDNWQQRPFRTPHHTASGVALVGGGSHPSPGEISLAHNGVLFLDELTEFDRHVLDVLREPMETGSITISRAARQAEFPARFQLIAAMNPCPQGYSCDGKTLCQCSHAQQKRHQSRLSAPLLDRIDIHIEVPRLDNQALDQDAAAGENSNVVATRVLNAYQNQIKRAGKSNAELDTRQIEIHCTLGTKEKALLSQAMEQLKLSARAYHRILKLARTIADLSDSQAIEIPHLTEAIGYRNIDRFKQSSIN